MKMELFFDALMIFGVICGIFSWILYDPATSSVIIMKALGISSLLLMLSLYIALNHKVGV